MIQATGWVVTGQRFDRVQQRLGDPPNSARWRWALPVAVAVLALVAPAARSETPAMHHAAREEPSDPPKTDVARPSLPPRARLRIGTDLLRTPGGIRSFALSPGGRLVAAGDLHAQTEGRYALPSHRMAGRSPPVAPMGWSTYSARCREKNESPWPAYSGAIFAASPLCLAARRRPPQEDYHCLRHE